jgi:putative ABC transport system permease protein
MAFQTLLAKKVRSILTMLGTVIGVTAVIALVSVTAAQNEANRNVWMTLSKNLVTVNFNSYEWQGGRPNSEIARELSQYLNEDLRSLASGLTPSAQMWNQITWQGKTLDLNNFYFGSEQFSLVNQYDIESGRDLSYMDIQRNTRVAVIGSLLRDTMFNYKDPIGETIYVKNEPYTIVGVYRATEKKPDYYSDEEFQRWGRDNMIVLPYTQARTLNPGMEMNNYMIKGNDTEACLLLVELITDFLGTMITRFDWNSWDWSSGRNPDTSGTNGDFWVYTATEYIEEQEQAEQSQANTMVMIAAISLLVGGIGIMNIMLVTVTERTREIGVRKAIGAPRRNIITQFLIEAAVLSGSGGVLGVVIGFAVTLYWGKIQFNIIASPDLGVTALAFGVSVAMGIVFGIYPAIKAAFLQPVDALRTE